VAATVNETIRALLEQTIETMQVLLDAADEELPMPSSHVCAQGKDVWTLITNDIDHEVIHSGQILDGRYESGTPRSPMSRLAAEWLQERARFIGSVVGMTDEQFNSESAPGAWTYRGIARHVLDVERSSLRAMEEDRARRRR